MSSGVRGVASDDEPDSSTDSDDNEGSKTVVATKKRAPVKKISMHAAPISMVLPNALTLSCHKAFAEYCKDHNKRPSQKIPGKVWQVVSTDIEYQMKKNGGDLPDIVNSVTQQLVFFFQQTERLAI
jgi:hypothetical protein